MSKQVGIAIGIILLLIVGGMGYMKLSAKTAPVTALTGNNAADNGSTMGSIKDLLASGKNVSCSVNYTGDQGGTSGTTYVSGKMMRSDFTMKDSTGKTTVSHMIEDGTNAYVWMDGVNTGSIMNWADVTSETTKPTGAAAQTQSQAAANLDQKANMNCQPWTVNPGMFVPPTTVTFTDLSAMMKNLPKVSASACDQITDAAAKAQCQAALQGQGY